MHRRTSHGNRLGLSIIGLLLTITGAAIIAAHLGAFGRRAANKYIYPQPAGDWLADHRWLYWIAAAIAVILAIFALRWLLVQFRTDPVHRLTIDTERNDHPDAGVTRLTGTAVLDAIGSDAERIIGVRNATSALSGHRDAPELWLTVTIDENADSGAIRTQLFDDVLRDARTALEKPDMPAYLNLKVSNKRTARQIR